MADIDSFGKLYGLIGYPLEHSFSMNFFNEKFEAEGINARYLNFEIENITDLMEIVSQFPNLWGLNVTAPYKEQVIPYLTSLDDCAKEIGAVNVIKFIRNGENLELIGFNSDAIAFKKSIEPLLDSSRTQALVLGSGGASKAVLYALKSLGVKCTRVSRRKSRETLTYEELTKAMIQRHKIIVNCTPLGTFPNVDTCPELPYRFIGEEHLCYDLVYNPDETLFLKKALKAGAEVKNGLEMLLLQAFESYDIWTR